MTVKSNLPAVPCILLLLAMMQACNPDDLCLSNQNAAQVSFYSYYTGSDTAIAEASVFGTGRLGDSIYSKAQVQQMFLPLSFDSDTTGFLVYDRTRLDTVRIVHTRELIFISRKCGFTFNCTIDTVLHTHTFIDSASIANRNVNYNENFENIKLYIY